MSAAAYSGQERRHHPRACQAAVIPFRLYDQAGTALVYSGQAWLFDLSLGGLRFALQGPAGPFAQAGDQSRRIDCLLAAADEPNAWLEGRTVWKSAPLDNKGPTVPTYLGLAWKDLTVGVSVVARILDRPAAPTRSSRDELAALLEISRLLNSSTDLDYLLHLILETVSRLLNAEGSSLLLLDPATQTLSFQMPFDPGSTALRSVRLKAGEGVAGWVVASSKPLLANDVRQDPRFSTKVDELTGFETKSILAAPLIDLGKVQGVIEVLNSRRPGGFTPEDQDLLAAFAVHAGVALRNAHLVSRISQEKDYWKEKTEERYRTLIDVSPQMQAVLHIARKTAATPATVLLLGESGVGKEILARAIHGWSPRAAKPFRAVNCAALSEQLLESELFGHEKGAFTGAHQQKKGLFELADGGTVFLDEIGEMKPELQAKLLRVLQDREFQRVGGTQPITVDIRLIAATNQDLQAAVQTGQFRKDLFYRLNVVALSLPPLRERLEDIVPLARYFLDRYCRDMLRAPMTLSPEAIEVLQRHSWPGNVRELENVIERAVILAVEDTVQPADLALEKPKVGISLAAATAQDLPFHLSLEEHKKELIRAAIAKAGGNKSKAAQALKLQPTYLFRLCKQLGIS